MFYDILRSVECSVTDSLVVKHARVVSLRRFERIPLEDDFYSRGMVASSLHVGSWCVTHSILLQPHPGGGVAPFLDRSRDMMNGRSLFLSAHDVRNHQCLSTRCFWDMSPEAVLGSQHISRDCSIDGTARESVSSPPTPCQGSQAADNPPAGTSGDRDAQGRSEEGDGCGGTPRDR